MRARAGDSTLVLKDRKAWARGASPIVPPFDPPIECGPFRAYRRAFSIVLAGGYVEERRDVVGGRLKFQVVRRIIRPPSLNRIGQHDFHRVELIEKDAWTLFVAGPKASSWGFWNRHTKIFSPWREFIQKKRSPDLWNRT